VCEVATSGALRPETWQADQREGFMIVDRTFFRGAISFLAVLAASMALGSGPADAQVPERRLARPDATFPEGFGLVRSVRELPDGRVMVADPLGQVLLIADMDAGTADTLGRVGRGPDEYRQPDGVFPLPGDSTLLVDLGNGRLTVLAPDGRFVSTMPIAQGEPSRGGGLVIVLPRGVDSRGRLYFTALGGRPAAGVPDSTAVLRLDRATGAIDTVARIGLPRMKVSRSGGPGDENVRMRPVPLSPQDGWAVGWDGRLAVARSADYHLEWVLPGGRVVRGPRVPYEPVKIRQADKEAWAEQMSSGLRIAMEVSDGERRVTFSRGGGGPGPELDRLEWPKTKPAYVATGVSVAPDGSAWVERHVPADAPTRYDVFDRDGRLQGAVVLPPGRRLVGFGRGTLYAVRTDELGVAWLERYRRPASLDAPGGP
jgi:hypothetical protein